MLSDLPPLAKGEKRRHRRVKSLDLPSSTSLSSSSRSLEPSLRRGSHQGSDNHRRFQSRSAVAQEHLQEEAAADVAGQTEGVSFEEAMRELSPRSRAQWERGKARFQKRLPNHLDEDQVEETDFRGQFKLIWSPDELWKTLEHDINRQASLEPGKFAASKRARSVAKVPTQMSNRSSRRGSSIASSSSTAGEVDAAEQIFRFHDTDGNGEINRHEFKKMLREARVLTGVDNRTFSRMVKEDFATIDTDNNIRISLQEFQEYVEKMRLATLQYDLLDHAACVRGAYGDTSVKLRGAQISEKLPGVKAISFGDGTRSTDKTYHVTRPVGHRRLPLRSERPRPRRRSSHLNEEGVLVKDSALSNAQKDQVANKLQSKGMTTSISQMDAESRMDLDDAIKADAEHRVNDLLQAHLKRRRSHREVLLCNGGLPPLVFAAIHGALKVVRVFMTKWSNLIDSSLLGCEKEIIIQACDSGSKSKVRHIVQDLYAESYKRSVLLATMDENNLNAARHTMKAVYFPPKETKKPKLMKVPRRVAKKIDAGEPWKKNVIGEDMISACKDDDFEVVQECLRSRVDPNYQDKNGNTALMAAGAKGNDLIVKTLIHCGASFDIVNKRLNTALHFIAEHKHRAMAIELIESNHDARECLLMKNALGYFPHTLSRHRDIYLSDMLRTMYQAQTVAPKRKKVKSLSPDQQPSRRKAPLDHQRSKGLRQSKASKGAQKSSQPTKSTPRESGGDNARSVDSSVDTNVSETSTVCSPFELKQAKPGSKEKLQSTSEAARAAKASAERRRTRDVSSTAAGLPLARRRTTGTEDHSVPDAKSLNLKGRGKSTSETVIAARASTLIAARLAKQSRKASLSRNVKDGFMGKGANWVSRSCMHNDMRALRNHIVSGYDVSRKDAFGLCAIHHACAVGNAGMVQILMEHKADVLDTTHEGNTVLHFLQNNMPRASEAMDLLWDLVPDEMKKLESMPNILGELPNDVAVTEE